MTLPRSTIGSYTTGICFCHKKPRPMTGIVWTGSPIRYVTGSPDAHIGDFVTGFCGHLGMIDTGSFLHHDTARPTARLGDLFTGCYCGHITTGKFNEFTL